MLKRQINTNMKGNVGVGSAIQYFTSQGWVVALPINDSQPYDLIVDIDGTLKRVQVKTTTSNDGVSWEVGLRISSTNTKRNKSKLFDGSLVDLLFILTEDGSRWLIPTEKIQGSSTISVGGKLYQEFKI
jgi:hypothetical protein